MTVDPQAAQLLEALRAIGAGPPGDERLAELRAGYELLLAAGAPIEPVASAEDGVIEGRGGPIPIRTYVGEGAVPDRVLLWYFSGGFTIGSLATAEPTARALANAARCTVVSVGYRLAPEHPFPAALDDAWAAYVHVRDTDAAAIAVAGASAGGNLATEVCLRAREEGIEQPELQLLVYPVTDVDFDRASYRAHAEGYLLEEPTMRWFLDCYTRGGADPYDWRIAPLRAPDLSGLAPAWIVTAEHDPLRDEGEAYARALTAAGVPVAYQCVEGMIHLFFELRGLLAPGQVALDAAAAELRRALRTE
jgi:acetyl esterase